MAKQSKNNQRVLELADLIVSDILDKGLGFGDRYLSTIETARMLKVATTDVNKAMQLLVKRHVLKRRQRLGTFIGKGLDSKHTVKLRKVSFLVSDSEIRNEGLFESEIMLGLQGSLPNAKIGIHLVSRDNEVKDLNHLIGDILRNPEPEGLILIGSTLYVQRTVAASGLPAVVLGHPYSSVKGILFVDRDPVQIGCELANHLLDLGCRRIVCVFRQSVRPGDHVMYDTVVKTLAARGLPGPNLAIRCLPFDREIVASEVHNFLESSEEPLGFLVQSPNKAAMICDIVAAKSNSGRPAALVASASEHRSSPEESLFYSCMRTKLSLKEQGELLGQMLVKRVEQGPSYTKSELLEMQLIPPHGL